MLHQQTIEKLKQLKLLGMAAAFERQLSQSAIYDLSFDERLGMLVDGEQTYRDNSRLNRLLKMAKLKQPACIEDINYTAQ